MTIRVYRAGKFAAAIVVGGIVGHLAGYLPFWPRVVFFVAAVIWLGVLLRQLRRLRRQLRAQIALLEAESARWRDASR